MGQEMSGNKILIVEDDLILSELLFHNLKTEGYEVITASNGIEGIWQFQDTQPDLVLLDLIMPIMNGWDVCQRIREVANTPIIMLSAHGNEDDIVRGLDLGADDYLIKPFRVRILMARIRTLLHRVRTGFESNWSQITYNDNYLSVDVAARQVMVNGSSVKLTPTEYKLLAYLVLHQGHTLEFRHILENVWGFEYSESVDYLRVYIWHLRRKIEPDPKQPVYLLNELNVGYRFKTA
jgi:two-component system, OmpR family, KDP operon response regulator KdpE